MRSRRWAEPPLYSVLHLFRKAKLEAFDYVAVVADRITFTLGRFAPILGDPTQHAINGLLPLYNLLEPLFPQRLT